MKLSSVSPAIALMATLLAGCSSGAPAGSAVPVAEATQAVAEAVAATTTPSPTPTVLAPADTVPKGKWNGPDEILKVTGAAKSWWDPVPKKGDVEKAGAPWEFASTCTAAECTGTIIRSTDAEDKLPPRNFTWDGKTLKITRDVSRGTDKCVSGDGTPNGSKWAWEQKWTYDVDVETDAEGRVVKLLSEVTLAVRDATKAGMNCGELYKPAKQVSLSTFEPTD